MNDMNISIPCFKMLLNLIAACCYTGGVILFKIFNQCFGIARN